MKRVIILLIAVLAAGFCRPAAAEDYLVGEGDVLKITVYDHKDMDATVRVSGMGTVSVALLGQVEVGGMSVSQIAARLSELWADGYIVDPQVAVFVEEFRSKKVIILGQLNKPGLYELRGQTTLLELISKAGGLTEDAGDQAIVKRRKKDGERDENVIVIDMKRLIQAGDTTLNLAVMDGDSIYINKAGVFYVTGEVKKPDAYKYEETTVIKAVTKAGGFTDKAAVKNVKIIRKTDDLEEVFDKVALDTAVLPGDVIVVPESFF